MRRVGRASARPRCARRSPRPRGRGRSPGRRGRPWSASRFSSARMSSAMRRRLAPVAFVVARRPRRSAASSRRRCRCRRPPRPSACGAAGRGRGRSWPAPGSSAPRYLLIVLALAGDSTMTRSYPPPPPGLARCGRSRPWRPPCLAAAFFAGRLLGPGRGGGHGVGAGFLRGGTSGLRCEMRNADSGRHRRIMTMAVKVRLLLADGIATIAKIELSPPIHPYYTAAHSVKPRGRRRTGGRIAVT